jgi:outer membrane protein
MKKYLLIIVAFPIAIFSQSQQTKAYSFNLEEAISFGIQNNYTIKNASRDIAISKQKKWETTAAGLPQINAGLDYQNNIVLQRSLFPAEFFGGPAGTFSEVALGTNQNMVARAGLSQLLFDGSYIVALQASKAYLQFFQNAKKKNDIEIKEMIINGYGSVLVSEETVKILQKNQTVLEKNLNDANQIFKNGLGEQETAEQIEITLASVKNNLNNVSRLKEISLKLLKINLGIDINDNLMLTDNLETLSQKNMADGLKVNTFETKNNIDYQIADSQVTQKRLLLKLEKSKALPTLGAQANFGYNAFSQTFTFTNTDQRWFNYANVGLSLNIPIFSSFARRARAQQAKLEFEKAETQRTQAEQMLQLQYQQCKSNFEFSLEEYATSKSNLNLAERIERKQQIKFKEGLSTSFEFSEAQRQLYSAQETYLQSMVNIINKKAALEKITTN